MAKNLDASEVRRTVSVMVLTSVMIVECSSEATSIYT